MSTPKTPKNTKSNEYTATPIHNTTQKSNQVVLNNLLPVSSPKQKRNETHTNNININMKEEEEEEE